MTAAAQDEEVLGEAKDVSEFQAEPPPNLGRRFRFSSIHVVGTRPLPSGAISSTPPHALTRVHVVEERRNTTGIETGETVGASATGLQQLLALLLLLRKHRE